MYYIYPLSDLGAPSSIYTQNLFLTKEWHGWGNPAHTGLLWRSWGYLVNFKLCSNVGSSLIRRGSYLSDPFTQDTSRSRMISTWRASPLQWPASPYQSAPPPSPPALCPTALPYALQSCCTALSGVPWPQTVPPRGPCTLCTSSRRALPPDLHGL